MAYKEDVIIIYSKVAWDNLIAQMSSNFLSKRERASAINLINSADLHQTDNHNNHMLFFDSIDSSHEDYLLLIQKLAPLTDQWRVMILGEDGMEDEYGYFANDKFNPHIHRKFIWDSGDIVPFSLNIPDPLDVVVAKSTIVKDDHTCVVCGNTKCSRQEKSCWRCGNPI